MIERPNIILIMTDQQRFDTISAWGYDYAITPAMDRLAAEGLSFRNAFCPGATCIASRAAIFIGMYPHNTGVYSFDHWGRAEQRELQNELTARLLRWLAASTYYNAGYRRQRSRQYAMRWPRPDDAFLHGARGRAVPRSFDL